ncbi:Calmodulin-binding transcription activator 6 [Zea mays]|uniref:Calmodulin-binding transcription activator 6 n=1 Tax=Zea mays TaxID=4577 RepID=A0A3L6E2S2_MAIZE|nr:Calmodulin-binding transcription activator 6 [Zea mays]
MAGGAGGRDPLVASEIHGFLTCAGRPAPPPHEGGLFSLRFLFFSFGGTVVLYDRKVVRNFRKDGHNWKKKKDGKTVQEAHEKLKIGNEEKVHVYYARGEDDPNFFRRCYWLLDKELERIVLVHYRQTSEESALPPSHVEAEVAEVPRINMIHYTSSTDSASAHTELSSSAAAAPEDINSNGGGAVSSETDNQGSSLESFWVDLLESSMKNDTPVDASACGGSLVSNQQTNNGMGDSGNNILYINATSNAIFSPPTNVVSEAYANPGLSQVSESYFGSLKDQANHAPSLLTSDLDSQSKQHTNSLMKTPVSDNMPNDVPARQNSLGLWKYLDDDISLDDNPSSGILPTEQVTGEIPFQITEISSEWAYCTEDTKNYPNNCLLPGLVDVEVLVVGCFHENYRHLAGTNLFCVIGDQCVDANIVQTGVYRFIARPHAPGRVNLYLTLDGKTPISEVLSFHYRMVPDSQNLAEDEPQKSKLQMQMRLARLLFTTNKKKIAPKLLVEGSKVSNLLSASTEKEWMDLSKFVTDSKGTYVPATEGLLELVLRNRLQEWLVEKLIEGHKSTGRDDLGQGPIHLCSCLGYTWAIHLFSLSGFSLDFRDSSGWTALHWAAYCGREKMVAALLSAGANPSLVTDPTHDVPGGQTAGDLAAGQGYHGLAAYLSEKGLTAHFEAMSLSKGKRSTSRTESLKRNTKEFENLSEQELCLRESLAAYRNAADAASNIQAALRERTLKLQTKAIQLANPENDASAIVAAMRIQHAYRNYNRKKMMRAAARIQSHFRTWQIRRNFMNMRRQAIKIQAAYRGHQVRRQYRKVLWSVGVVEKAILRWRKKRKGLRGIATGMPVAMATDAEAASTAEEDYYQVGRQQAEDRFNRSVVRVQALFRSHRAQQEYRRMKVAHEEAKVRVSPLCLAGTD